MSILGTILSRIFGTEATAQEAAPPSAAGADIPAPPADSLPAGLPAGMAPPSSAAPVDVAAVLTALAAKSGQTLNWKQSVVDLMKLLGLDSSLSARKELARELNYSGDTNDSASMNIWLHKQVMAKLAENGGVVPPELRN